MSSGHDDGEKSADNGEDEDGRTDAAAASVSGEPLSKRQQKRLVKMQHTKDKRKEKKQAVKEAKRAKREASQATWDALTEEEREEQRQKSAIIRAERVAAMKAEAEAAARAADENRIAPTCIVDLAFEELMNEREIASLASQLSYCYCANRRAGFPMKLHYTSFGGALPSIMTCGYRSWLGVRYEEQHYLAAYPRERLVYLSSEGDETLSVPLDPDTVYIVGGLVDHNRQKGLTHRLATEAGIRTAKLPIDEHCEMATRKVLAVNHVVEILVQLASGVGWQPALLKVIPERKGAKERDDGGNGHDGQEEVLDSAGGPDEGGGGTGGLEE